ncbi:MAG: hypothetical protein U0359_24880 [Byssovorax sp.]
MARGAHRIGTYLPLIGSTVLALAAAGGCQTILGIKDVELDTSGTGGAGGAATSTTSTMSTTTGSTGQSQPDYSLSIKAASVTAPINGKTAFSVEIIRTGGFDLPVEIKASGEPDGVVFTGTTIAGGETKGKVAVGATPAMPLGTTFDLTLVATSGDKTKIDSVSVTVTGEPGTLDKTFGTGGVATWSWNAKYGKIESLRVGGDGKILASGYTESAVHGAAMSGARLTADGTLDTTFNMTGVLSESICGCLNAGEDARGAFRVLTGDVLFLGSARRPDKTDRDIVLLRRKDDGSPIEIVPEDKGAHLLPLGQDENVVAAALTSTDLMLALGTTTLNLAPKMFLARITPTGIFDTNFGGQGSNGYLTFDSRVPYALAIDGKGRAIVASMDPSMLLPVHWIDRFDAQGKPAGSVQLQTTPSYSTVALVVLPGDEVGVIGYEGLALSLQRLDASLMPIGAATVLDPMPGGDDIPVGAVTLPDGRVVVLGNHASGGPFLARFAADGTIDTTLGDGNGWVDIVIGGAQADAITLAADGKLLIAGSSTEFNIKTGVVGKVWN